VITVSLVALVSLARFTFPLFTSRFGRFSVTPDVATSGVWLGVLYASAVLRLLLPMLLRNTAIPVDELLSRDRRKPIVYLRSFAKEQAKAGLMKWTRFVRGSLDAPKGIYMFSRAFGEVGDGERVRVMRLLRTRRSRFDEQLIFAHAMSAEGPYIAIGRPGGCFSNMDLGAAKKYVSDDEWQATILQWLSQCAGVVVEAADSDGLGWEIGQVLRIVPPTCVLVICPHTEQEYRRFTRAYGMLFVKGLPEARPKSRLLTFDGSWEPIELKNVDQCVAASLEPFFRQIRRRNSVGS